MEVILIFSRKLKTRMALTTLRSLWYRVDGEVEILHSRITKRRRVKIGIGDPIPEKKVLEIVAFLRIEETMCCRQAADQCSARDKFSGLCPAWRMIGTDCQGRDGC